MFTGGAGRHADCFQVSRENVISETEKVVLSLYLRVFNVGPHIVSSKCFGVNPLIKLWT